MSRRLIWHLDNLAATLLVLYAERSMRRRSLNSQPRRYA